MISKGKKRYMIRTHILIIYLIPMCTLTLTPFHIHKLLYRVPQGSLIGPVMFLNKKVFLIKVNENL